MKAGLLLGSEGTPGIITAALKIFPAAPARAVTPGCRRIGATGAGAFIGISIPLRSPDRWVIATSSRQAQALWQLREDIPEAQRIDGPHLKHDVSLPIERISGCIDTTEERLFSLDAGVRL